MKYKAAPRVLLAALLCSGCAAGYFIAMPFGMGGGCLFEGVFDGVVGHHLFLEGVCTCFGALHHLDYLAVGTSFAFLERCNGFLCHISEVFILFLYGWSCA